MYFRRVAVGVSCASPLFVATLPFPGRVVVISPGARVRPLLPPLLVQPVRRRWCGRPVAETWFGVFPRPFATGLRAFDVSAVGCVAFPVAGGAAAGSRSTPGYSHLRGKGHDRLPPRTVERVGCVLYITNRASPRFPVFNDHHASCLRCSHVTRGLVCIKRSDFFFTTSIPYYFVGDFSFTRLLALSPPSSQQPLLLWSVPPPVASSPTFACTPLPLSPIRGGVCLPPRPRSWVPRHPGQPALRGCCVYHFRPSRPPPLKLLRPHNAWLVFSTKVSTDPLPSRSEPVSGGVCLKYESPETLRGAYGLGRSASGVACVS